MYALEAYGLYKVSSVFLRRRGWGCGRPSASLALSCSWAPWSHWFYRTLC